MSACRVEEILQIACVLHTETSVLFFALFCRFNCVHFESILGGRYRSRGPKRRGPVLCNSPIFGINVLFFLYGKMLRLLFLDAVSPLCWRDMCTIHPFQFNPVLHVMMFHNCTRCTASRAHLIFGAILLYSDAVLKICGSSNLTV
jgi:hypothetical protein